jgi:adenosine deaminase
LALMGAGTIPDIGATSRAIFIADRRSEHRRPDHFYKAYIDHRLEPTRQVADLPWEVLSQLSARYLERRDGRIRVQYERFLEWHELLPFVSPLSIVMTFLVAEGGGPGPGIDPRAHLASEIGDSALIGPLDLHLDDLVEREGLHELHMHLNGSTELEVLWNAAVTDPDAFYREIEAAWSKNKAIAAELYDQIEPGLTPYAVYKRLRAARRVRRLLVDALASGLPRGMGVGGMHSAKLHDLIDAMSQDTDDRSVPSVRGLSLAIHPSDLLFGPNDHRPIVNEAAWLYASLQHLSRRPPDPAFGTGFYFTLLVLSQVRRLSVQQTDEYGFDQFQKYTMVGTRESLERNYLARFRQINLREPYDVLAHLEGRFSPKDDVTEGGRQISRIVGDFQDFAGCRRRGATTGLPMMPAPCMTAAGCPGPPCTWQGSRLTELALVGHFIKRAYKPQSDVALATRDSELRVKVERQARVLKRLVRNGTIGSIVRGVDAAANELDAGAEPFAPAYRMARRSGIPRATFHAGEDFRHLVSGIRAVEEALTFLDLRAGDRIGHATAVGIDPAIWMERAGSRAMLRRHDLLDDLVYSRRRLAAHPTFGGEVVRLDAAIALHSRAVYGDEISPVLLDLEWHLRSMDPLAAWRVDRVVGCGGRSIDLDAFIREARHQERIAVDEEAQAEFAHVAVMIERYGAAYELFRRRHRLPIERRREWVEVESRFLSEAACIALQDHVLGEVNLRGVALEALPTSNLRISHYHVLSEHHLFRWLGLRGPELRNRPTVVIGSDDPGIFATNLKNEFAAIAAVLRSEFHMSAERAAATMSGLNAAARIRRFRPRPGP